MSVLDRVKNHISNNRGKYGVVAGAGTAYGLSQIDPNNINPMINQAAFNTMAQGQNLALNVADKIGYGKEQLQNLGINHTIDQKQIDAANAFYNNPVGKVINPSAATMLNDAEKQSIWNDPKEGVFQNVLNFGKKINPFHENTNIGNKMKIEIKKALLEGTLPDQIITEAVHTNHPTLSKDKRDSRFTSYTRGNQIQLNRDHLAQSIKNSRKSRDYNRSIDDHSSANYSDNFARGISQTGKTTTSEVIHGPTGAKELSNFSSRNKSYTGKANIKEKTDPMGSVVSSNPRLISSAKK